MAAIRKICAGWPVLGSVLLTKPLTVTDLTPSARSDRKRYGPPVTGRFGLVESPLGRSA